MCMKEKYPISLNFRRRHTEYEVARNDTGSGVMLTPRRGFVGPRYVTRVSLKTACTFVVMTVYIFLFRQLCVNEHLQYLLNVTSIKSVTGTRQITPCAVVSNRPKVAVIAYGLPRSLRFTISSIEQNIIAPLEEAGFDTCIYAHTYLHSKPISNARSREKVSLWITKRLIC